MTDEKKELSEGELAEFKKEGQMAQAIHEHIVATWPEATFQDIAGALALLLSSATATQVQGGVSAGAPENVRMRLSEILDEGYYRILDAAMSLPDYVVRGTEWTPVSAAFKLEQTPETKH